MPVVRLGNTSAQQQVPGETGDPVAVPLPGNRVTSVMVPADRTRQETIRDIAHADGLWAQHSTAPAPVWVEADDPELAAALGLIYGCPVGRPEDWEVQQ